MKKVLFVLASVTLFIFTSAFDSYKLSPIEGKWSGEFKGNTEAGPFQTHFWTENDEIKGTIDFPKEKVYGLELSWIIVEYPSVHFEITRKSEILVFDGKLFNTKLIGEFRTKADHGTFDLSRP
jgi:hypothetical protein